MTKNSPFKLLPVVWLLMSSLFFSSCYTYRVATQAKAGTETNKPITTHSFFCGLVQKPKEIHTPM